MITVDLAQSLGQVKASLDRRFPAVQENYPYLVPVAGGQKPEIARVDVAAFLDNRRQDMSTVAIAAHRYPTLPTSNPLSNGMQYLDPVLLLAIAPTQIQWWVGQADQPVVTTTVDTVEADFAQRRITQEDLRRAKHGLQTSLFSRLPEALDLARLATGDLVRQRFTEALIQVHKQNGVNKLTAVGLDLLTAIILDDKRLELGIYTEASHATDAHEALRRAQHYFPYSFRNTPSVPEDILATFWSYLREDMTYRSLSPDDLSDLMSALYEGVLLDPARRRHLGSYYTPRSLAGKVLAHLPIEEIPPEERIIFDGACGSGNLLRAAIERLDPLFGSNVTPRERANYLSDHLIGTDIDKFAVDTARKALLLANLPFDRDWKIQEDDFLKPLKPLGAQPTIIITNPPFMSPSGQGGEEVAGRFLRRYIELLRPGGLLGIFLPASLIQKPAGTAVRRQLLDQCDLLELWLLPQETIPGSRLNVAVLLLKKHTARQVLSRVYVVDKLNCTSSKGQPSTQSCLATFASGQNASSSFTVNTDYWRNHPKARIQPVSLLDLWNRLETYYGRLADVYQIKNGVRANSAQLINQPAPDHRKALSRKAGFDSFGIRWDRQLKGQYIYYPDDPVLLQQNLPGHRDSADFKKAQKLVIQGERNAASPWRLVAAMDREQLVVTDSFYYVLPQAYSLTVLMAILNSSVANAWYSEHDIDYHIQKPLLKSLPIPHLLSEQVVEIEQVAEEIAQHKAALWGAAIAKDPRWEAVRNLVRKLDGLIADAYSLSEKERLQIEHLMQRGKRPGMEWQGTRPPLIEPILLQPERTIQLHPTGGSVQSINLEEHTMVVELPGLARMPLRFPIPPTIPGWALREGVAFSACIPQEQAEEIADRARNQPQEKILNLESLSLYRIEPPRLAYFTDDQLWTYQPPRRQE